MDKREKDDFKVSVGEYYKKQRKEKGYTQDDVAHALDLSNRWVQKFEKGEIDISLSRFVQITHFLDVSYSYVEEFFHRYAFRTYQDRIADVKERKGRKNK